MAFQYDGDKTTAAGEKISAAGWYHVAVESITENPVDYQGKLKENAAFEAAVVVLAGTDSGQKNKKFNITFHNEKPGDHEFVKQKNKALINRFFLAMSLLKQEELGTPKPINLEDALSRQMVIQIEMNPGSGTNANKTYANMATDGIYHVDDPACATVPKDERALKHIPPARRLIGSQPTEPVKSTTSAPAMDLGKI